MKSVNKYKLQDKSNKYYKYAIKQEIIRGASGNTAPHKYPPDIDLHPLINSYRNKKFFNIDSNDESGWYYFLSKQIGTVKKGLTLGSGEGRHEKYLSKIGVVEEWTSIDITENPLDDFSSNNKNKFINGDLNFIKLPENEYDIVYCHGVLHHIINLEYLLEQLYKTLKPHGVLVVYEFVGESKWQWSEKRLQVIRKKIINRLDNKYKGISLNVKSIPMMNRRPLESIRAAEIYSLIHNYFIPKYESYWNLLLYPFLNSRNIPKKNNYTGFY